MTARWKNSADVASKPGITATSPEDNSWVSIPQAKGAILEDSGWTVPLEGTNLLDDQRELIVAMQKPATGWSEGTANDGPSFVSDPPADVTVAKGSKFSHDLYVVDIENQDVTVSVSGATWLEASQPDADNKPHVWNISGTAPDASAEEATITLTASDDSTPAATSTQTFKVTVANAAPVFTTPVPEDITCKVGDAVTFDVAVTDADAKDTITVSVSGVSWLTATESETEPGTWSIAGTPTEAATVAEVTLTATDNDATAPATATQKLNVTVEAAA
jgi:hypothetical protein